MSSNLPNNLMRSEPLSERPETEEPLSLVIDALIDLVQRSTHHQGQGINLLERYDFFTRNSNRGRACTYAYKCKQLFLLSDYQEVKTKVLELLEKMREVEGDENFGKE